MYVYFKKDYRTSVLENVINKCDEVSNLRPKAYRAIVTMFDQNKKRGVRLLDASYSAKQSFYVLKGLSHEMDSAFYDIYG
jgi:hypothetical protein